MICPASTSMVAGRSAVRAARTASENACAPLSEVPTTNCARARAESPSWTCKACGTSPMLTRSLGSSPGIAVTSMSVIESQVRRQSEPVRACSVVSARCAAEASRSGSAIGSLMPNVFFQSSGRVRPSSPRFG